MAVPVIDLINHQIITRSHTSESHHKDVQGLCVSVVQLSPTFC